MRTNGHSNGLPPHRQRQISRRELIKVGGIGALGLAFTKPAIDTIFPKPAFANYLVTSPNPTPTSTPSCTAPSLANGSFELPDLSPAVFGTSVDSWSTPMGGVGLLASGGFGWSPDSPDGGQKVFFFAAPAYIAQVIATEAGCSYRVDFYLANHPADVNSAYSVRVSAASTTQDYTATLSGQQNVFSWTMHSFFFTGIGSATTLMFTSLTSPQEANGVALDGITISLA